MQFEKANPAGCGSKTQLLSGLQRRQAAQRRGAALVLGLLLSVALLILTAVTMDLGYIRVAQTELRRSADAAAMAGCWELFDQKRVGDLSSYNETGIASACDTVAALNAVGDGLPVLGSGDLQVGRYGLDGSWSTADIESFNAVRVTLRRDSGANGQLPLFFGKLTGRDYQSLSATATAAMFNAIDGFYEPEDDETLGILPIALDLETWLQAVASQTTDQYSFENGQVQSGTDGSWEANLYPQGTGSPGNRGTVDIGGANNSTSDLSRQILEGISKQDLIDLGKPLQFDDNGELNLNGDTGISAGIKDELATLIGKTRMIPIYSRVAGNGNNATFTIVRWEGVRILDVKLTGKKSEKRVIVQPEVVVARGAKIDYSGNKVSSYLFTPVLLVE